MGAPCECLPAWNSRRRLLRPFVPGGLRQGLLLGRTPLQGHLPPHVPVSCSPSLLYLCPGSFHMPNLEQAPSEPLSQTCAGERQPHLISSLSNVQCANTAWPVTLIPLLKVCSVGEVELRDKSWVLAAAAHMRTCGPSFLQREQLE